MIRRLMAIAVLAASVVACSGPKPVEKAPVQVPAQKVTAAHPGYKPAKSATLAALVQHALAGGLLRFREQFSSPRGIC